LAHIVIGGIPPVNLGKYQVISLLGKGAFGEVVRATLDGPMGFKKQVALKRIHPHLVESNEKFVQSLVNEARLGGLLRHQNIVETYEFSQAGAAWYIAMEFVEGVSLDMVIERCRQTNTRLPPKLVLEMGEQMCAGLQYAHGLADEEGSPLGLVHRDLKPANLMLSKDGLLKIMDFGIAKAASNLYQTTQTGTVKGTLSYMSPEQVRGGANVDHRSDLFAVGVILHELLTTERLFVGENQMAIMFMVVQTDVRERVLFLNKLHPGLGDVLAKCLSPSADDRWNNAQELGRALRVLRQRMPGDENLGEAAALLAKSAEDVQLPEDDGHSGQFATFLKVFFDTSTEARWNPRTERPMDEKERASFESTLAAAPSAGGKDAATVIMAQGSGGVISASVPHAPPKKQESKLVWLVLGLVLLLAAIMVPMAYLLFTKPDPEPQQVVIREVVKEAPAAPAPPPATPKPQPVVQDPAPAVAQTQQVRNPQPQLPPEPQYEGTGVLKIKSSPWSFVEIDGARVGKTPFRAEAYPAGPHKVRLVCGECDPPDSKNFDIVVPKDGEKMVQGSFDLSLID
jgi:serine/threonine-protein kinase